MKADFHVIASGGEHYDEMKRAFVKNWESEERKRFFPDSELRFLYGTHASPGSGALMPCVHHPGDTFVSCEENVIPGLLLKTLSVMKLEGVRERWLVRTNLSSFYLWKELREFLDELEKEDVDATGYSETLDHFSGCCLVLGPRAIEKIISSESVDYSVEDDVALSRIILSDESLKTTWSARIDVLGENVVHRRRCEQALHRAFHFRVKSFDRSFDVAMLRSFAEDPKRASRVAETCSTHV